MTIEKFLAKQVVAQGQLRIGDTCKALLEEYGNIDILHEENERLLDLLMQAKVKITLLPNSHEGKLHDILDLISAGTSKS